MRKESGIARKPWVPFRRTSLKTLAVLAVAYLAIQKIPFPRPAPPPPAAAPAAAPATPPPAAPVPAPAAPPVLHPPIPEPAEASRPAAKEAPPPENQAEPRVPKVWRVSGKVYDLFSLSPIEGALVFFKDKVTGRSLRAKSDKKGFYSTPLPPMEEGGYFVSVRRTGYEPNFLEEKTPPYRQYTQDRREEEGVLARQSQILHVPIRPEGSGDSLEYSIVLIPIPEE